MSKTLIVDGNNIGCKEYFALRGRQLTTSSGIETTVICGVLAKLNYFLNQVEETFDKTILVWDVGGSHYRKGMFPHYKGNRKYEDMDGLFKQLDFAREIFKKLGIYQVYMKGIEADDVIGLLAKKNSKDGNEVVIISDDIDMSQLINKRVRQWRMVDGRYLKKKDIVERYGVLPKHLPYLYALSGQAKDNIPGLKCWDSNGKTISNGFGEKKAQAVIVDMVENKRKFYDQCMVMCKDPKWGELFNSCFDNIKLSLKLSKIRTKPEQFSEINVEDLVNMESIGGECTLGKVNQIKDLLEIRHIKVEKIIKRIGVKMKKKNKSTVKAVVSKEREDMNINKKGKSKKKNKRT